MVSGEKELTGGVLPGNADGCEKKGVAAGATQKVMKIKDHLKVRRSEPSGEKKRTGKGYPGAFCIDEKRKELREEGFVS